jgi:acetylornithine/succinyldiaminopimelate/putrescine aminotransferase
MSGSSHSAHTADAAKLLSGFFRSVAQTSDSPMGIVVESARGATLRAADGNEYIDLLGGIGVAALGHGHPRVLAAIAEQAKRHLHVMVYGELVQEAQVRLAERLTGLLPPTLDNVYFTNSGAEAIEGSIKLVRKATERTGIVSFVGGFHGDTLGALSVGGNPHYREPFAPLVPNVTHIRFDEPTDLARIDTTTAAVFVEPVQGEAGVIIPRPGFLTALRARCTEVGALLVYDEVITGFGRTGRLFAFQHEGAVPDVLVVAKALGGGLPLGAFITSKSRMKTLAFDPPLGHVTTFGGHPLSCAAGLAALEVLLEENLAEKARERGATLAGRLRARLPADELVAIRQIGLLLGVELRSARFVERLTRECRREGVILGWTLNDDRVLRLAPPLVISDAELDEATLRMERAAARATDSSGRK